MFYLLGDLNNWFQIDSQGDINQTEEISKHFKPSVSSGPSSLPIIKKKLSGISVSSQGFFIYWCYQKRFWLYVELTFLLRRKRQFLDYIDGLF